MLNVNPDGSYSLKLEGAREQSQAAAVTGPAPMSSTRIHDGELEGEGGGGFSD